jgi:peptidoglycan-associated lipoprotein
LLKAVFKYLPLLLILLAVSCKTVPFKVKDADTAVRLKLYNQSIDFLTKEFNEAKDPATKAQKAFELGESYRKFNDLPNAEKWYQQSVDLKGPDKALYELGLAQKGQEKYQQAYKNFEEYQKVAGTGFEGRRQMSQCVDAVDWKKEFTKLQVKNLESLNTPANDYGLVPYKDHQFVFSSSRDESTGNKRDGWTGQKTTDLFVTERKNNIYGTPHNFGAPVNTDAHESSPAFSKDMREMYFIRCKEDQQKSNQYCHLFYSTFDGEQWNEPVQLNLFPDTVNVFDPFLSKDGKVLLLASDAPGGFGGTDLYICRKTDTGWTAPSNMTGKINTAGSERFPWIDDKGSLYFSSDGWPGMGGLDIFKAIRTKEGYRDPMNMKSPINSGGDDFAYRIDKYRPTSDDDTILYSGFFSSNRAGGKGGDDIYRFEEKWINVFVLRGKVVEKNYEKPDDPESKVSGLKNLPKARVDLKTSDDKVIASTFSDSIGNFAFRLNAETDYKLSGIKNGYFANNTTASTKGKRNQDSTIITVYAQLELEKIFPQKMIVIPNIYYDYDKATLRPESERVLDSILIFFKENPDLTIEIGSHTDSRGTDAYNNKLSQARAQSVVDYLVAKGIPVDRLLAKGYGKTMLLNKCATGVPCTEEEHQLNRRTTFRVASAKLNLESIQPEDIRVVPKPDETPANPPK